MSYRPALNSLIFVVSRPAVTRRPPAPEPVGALSLLVCPGPRRGLGTPVGPARPASLLVLSHASALLPPHQSPPLIEFLDPIPPCFRVGLGERIVQKYVLGSDLRPKPFIDRARQTVVVPRHRPSHVIVRLPEWLWG